MKIYVLGQSGYVVKKIGEPEEFKRRILPNTLRLVGGNNRAILLKVISFQPEAREDAEEWLASLRSYQIMDGSDA